MPHPVGFLSGGFADTEACQQVWSKTWTRWPGQVPPDMSPVDSLSELKGCIESSPAEYRPLPLDEPSPGLHSLATSLLLPRLDQFETPFDSERVSRWDTLLLLHPLAFVSVMVLNTHDHGGKSFVGSAAILLGNVALSFQSVQLEWLLSFAAASLTLL